MQNQRYLIFDRVRYSEVPEALSRHTFETVRCLPAAMLAPLIGQFVAALTITPRPFRFCNQGRQMGGRIVDYLEFRNDESLHDPMEAPSLEAPALRPSAAVCHMIVGAYPELLGLAYVDWRTIGMTMMILKGWIANRINDIAPTASELSYPLHLRFHSKLKVPELQISDVTGHQNCNSRCLGGDGKSTFPYAMIKRQRRNNAGSSRPPVAFAAM